MTFEEWSWLLDTLRTARMQASLAMAMYGDLADVLDAATVAGVRSWHATRCDNLLAVTFEFSDHWHVSVCGSNDACDWRDNFQADTTQLATDLHAHRGFATSAERLRRLFMLEDQLSDGRPVVFGGHSAGGAIAEILAWKMHVLDVRTREVVTFGAPRVWTQESAVSYRQRPWRVHRFTMPGDVVPFLPRRRHRLLFARSDYSHAVSAMELNDDGKITMQDSRPWWFAMVSLLRAAMAEGVSAIGIRNVFDHVQSIRRQHSIERYRQGIDTAIARYQ